jgi:fumarate hydratase class II
VSELVTIDGKQYRKDHDTMGDVFVPAEALYQAQTQRAVENFPISGHGLEHANIVELARVKKAAAIVNARRGIIPEDIGAAIESAAQEIIDGKHFDQFPIDVYQTGSGTSSNMNTNEVISTIATAALGKTVHPNDHVNASQSSNDVYPTSVHLAATSALVTELIPSLQHLHASLAKKSVEWATVVKSGRTHLMDATPVTLGQEFGGYARQIELGIERIQAAIPRVAEVPLGGTATGTGINTPLGFSAEVIAELAKDTGLPITEAKDHFEAQGARDALVEASGVLKVIAVSLAKINNDLRWMGSGPNTGLGELHIPDLQPGSSIMPGKVNPVIPEATLQVVSRVIGNDAAITFAGASGSFELNVQIPVIANALLESIRLLTNSTRVLADKTIDGLEANVARAKFLAEASPSIVTPLNKIIGYEAAAKIAKHAVAKGLTVRESVIDLGYVERGEITEALLDEKLDVLSMTHPS